MHHMRFSMRYLMPYNYLLAIAEAGSIRKASEVLAITPSALNRRLLSIEEELGVPLFERLPEGVRPSTAGEIFLQHVREQISEMDRVQSRIADLSGMRLGRVSIAVSHEASGPFLSDQVATYRANFPAVTFDVRLCSRQKATDALLGYHVDIALLFEPKKIADFQIAFSVKQPFRALAGSSHSLIGTKPVRLYELADYPLLLPPKHSAVNQMVKAAALKQGINIKPAIEADSPWSFHSLVSDQDHVAVELALNSVSRSDKQDLQSIAIDERDLPSGFLFVGFLKSRTLPVASARFLEQLVEALAADGKD